MYACTSVILLFDSKGYKTNSIDNLDAEKLRVVSCIDNFLNV